MHMYLLNQFLQPVFKEICVNVTMTDKPITKLEVQIVSEHLTDLGPTITDRLQENKHTTEVSPFERLNNTGGCIV